MTPTNKTLHALGMAQTQNNLSLFNLVMRGDLLKQLKDEAHHPLVAKELPELRDAKLMELLISIKDLFEMGIRSGLSVTEALNLMRDKHLLEEFERLNSLSQQAD